jgi:hypothetical protein
LHGYNENGTRRAKVSGVHFGFSYIQLSFVQLEKEIVPIKAEVEEKVSVDKELGASHETK